MFTQNKGASQVSLDKNQVSAVIYQLRWKLQLHKPFNWYIKQKPNCVFQYLENGDLAYWNHPNRGLARELMSLVELEQEVNLLDSITFLDQLIEDAQRLLKIAETKRFEYYLYQVEKLY
jgi:hypothetical protein